jgi:putative DNA primase/helicase
MSTPATPGGERPPRRRRPAKTVGQPGAVVPLHGYRHTDLGNAERVVHQHVDELRYVSDTGQWFTWDGSRWAMDHDRAGVKLQVIGTIRSMYRAAGDPECSEDRKALAAWAMASESRPRIEAAVSLAEVQPQLRVSVSDLDPDPMVLGVRNGVIDLRTGGLREPSPPDLITQQANVDYDPTAECPLWLSTLKRIQPDPQMRAFLQRCIGYALTGFTREQVMFLIYGRGANGKSLVVETLSALLGGYAQKAPSDLLLARASGSDLSNDVARLRGARFVTAVETDEGRRLAEARVKELTGGDTVTARFLHREFFQFRPVCKVFLVTNHRPRIAGTDDGIWRRLVMLPFTQYIGPDERDMELGDKLLAELPGILAWAVRGCLDWQRQGLNPPAGVLSASGEYRAEQDVIGAFLDECCVVREGVSVGSSALYTEYQSWCEENGHSPFSQTALGIKFRERGFERTKRGTMRWHGVALRADVPDDGLVTSAEVAPAPSKEVPVEPQVSVMSFDTCRVCGERCDPVCNGVHVNCADREEDVPDPDNDPDDGPEDPSGGPGGGVTPTPDPTPPGPSSGAHNPAEPEDETAGEAVVTSRRRRPWTAKSTAFVTWSSGAGVDDAGAEVRLPGRARVGAFLAALPADVQRVVLVGAMPGKTGPGLQAWVTDDLKPGWTEAAAGHYLDPDALAARYRRPDGGEVHVHRLASWVRDTSGTIRPETARAAFALLRAGLGEVFGRRRLAPGQRDDQQSDALAPAILSSPASTGRELLLRTLPAGHQYPVLDDEHLELLHHTTGQGRNELLTEDRAQHPTDELPGLYSYDMRWAYAALCRGVTGTGPARLDHGTEFLGYAPARYEVDFRVPERWDHLGLLGVYGEGWPSTPGSRWRTWCDARELRLADRWGWRIGQDVRIVRRLRLSTDKSAPLRTWADKLTEVRETWLPAQDAPAAVVALARDMTRTVLLASLGALQGRRQKVTHAVPQDRAAEVPTGVDPTVAGGMLVWQTETAAGWREMVHPEWVGQVWAEQRCRLLDTGPNAAQANVGALHLPRLDLVALRTDAVYSTTDPGWPDTGKVGQFRPQLRLDRSVPTPRCLDDLMALRSES